MNWEGEQIARKNRLRVPAAIGGAATGLAAWFLVLSPLLSIRPPEPPASLPDRAPRLPADGGGQEFSFPTERSDLMSWISGEALQPTAAGNPESALYGSGRTRRTSGGFAAAFHEGIDIAPASRDRRGRARDRILAAAPGRVAYLNRHPGNSSYGVYAVLLHQDPIGEIYTLYAHLESLSPDLKTGAEVAAGADLGRMGNTAAGGGIPLSRSHLHFEIGLLLNRHFTGWTKQRRTKNPHGRYHGWNLQGLDPLKFFAGRREGGNHSFRDFLAAYPRAFRLLVRAKAAPDYFLRHPLLWDGPGPGGGRPLVLECSDNGTVLSGRAAQADEAALLGNASARVLEVDREVLGRNGARLLREKNGAWELGPEGKRWLSILLWPHGS